MKYSYTDSLITSLHINKKNNAVAYITIKNLTEQFNTITYPHKCGVGIKFDNIIARKYFALAHTTQRFAVINKTKKSLINVGSECR